jgi:hypothetical protein
MFILRRWMHMVMNIGDTMSVVSEVDLRIGEGKRPEDFLYDPGESSDDTLLRVALVELFCCLPLWCGISCTFRGDLACLSQEHCPVNQKCHSYNQLRGPVI